MARAAGVSATTVSHALNNKGRVTQTTRERIQEVATRLGYRPHPAAQRLAGRKSGLVAVVVSTAAEHQIRLPDYAYFQSLMDGAAAAALSQGAWPVLTPSGGDPEALLRLDLDGALVVDPSVGDRNLEVLRGAGIPLVISGRDPDGSHEGSWVDNDFDLGTRMVLNHLREQGARRIALLNAPEVSSYTMDIRRAYTDWCAEEGVEPVVATVEATIDETAGYTAALDVLSSPEPPDGIFATLDRVALGVLLAANAVGLRVPQDLLVVGMTNSVASQTVRPALSVLDLHEDRVGKLAVELLLDLVENPRLAPKQIHVPVSLEVRESSVRA